MRGREGHTETSVSALAMLKYLIKNNAAGPDEVQQKGRQLNAIMYLCRHYKLNSEIFFGPYREVDLSFSFVFILWWKYAKQGSKSESADIFFFFVYKIYYK